MRVLLILACLFSASNVVAYTEQEFTILSVGASKFYSMALAASAQNKTLIVGYEPYDCFANGIEPRVFKVK